MGPAVPDALRSQVVESLQRAVARLVEAPEPGRPVQRSLGVARLPLSSETSPVGNLTRLCDCLVDGYTAVGAVLYSGRPAGGEIEPLIALSALAVCLPPGVLNGLAGLGLELGLPLASFGTEGGSPATRAAAQCDLCANP